MYENIKTTEGVRNIFEIMEKIEEVEDTIFLAHKVNRSEMFIKLIYYIF